RSARRGLALARISFMAPSRSAFEKSLEAVGDPPLGQVIGRHFDQHLVASQHPDAVLAHLAGRVSDDLVVVFQFYSKGGVGQQFADRAWKLQQLFFRHATSSSADFLTAMPMKPESRLVNRRLSPACRTARRFWPPTGRACVDAPPGWPRASRCPGWGPRSA